MHYTVIVLALVLATIYFHLGLAVELPGSTASIRFIAVGAVFLLGVGVYLAPLR